ncbi:MAG: HD domain-containing protein [Nitrospira sp.]|nr:HD domain-containing protein [Nitrospira sp.]
MQVTIPTTVNPAVLKIQGLLRKTDHLRLPIRSRRDIESILMRQVSKEIDRTLPWQTGHGQRTAAVALALGQAAGLHTEALHQVKLAALLHDIGRLMLPPDLIEDRGSLEPESYIAIQHHARLGANLLEPFAFLQEASILIAHHHERWDGSGYPYGIRSTFIPLGARILSIADAFDAIFVPEVSERSLRNHIAMKIIRVASGTQFDPRLVQLLDCCLIEGGHDQKSTLSSPRQ